MGFLDVFRAKEKRYPLHEAMEIIEKELERLDKENLEQANRDAMMVESEIRQLLVLIDEFSRKPTPELGKSSENVKERFCLLSRKQLASLGTPDKSRPQEFLRAVRSALDSLGGLTQRQVLHINFFFKEDFKPAGKKINEISSIISGAAGVTDHHKAVEMNMKLASMQNQKKLVENSIAAGEAELRSIGSRSMPELPHHPDTNSLNAAESKVSSKRQEIDSFLSVQKTLKKYLYISEAREPVVESYIESPSSALLADENLSVLGHLSRASELAKAGKIENDRKLDIIVSAAPYLRKSREELAGMLKNHELEKKKYFGELESFESSIKERANILSDRENETKMLEKTIKSEKEELDTLSREIDRTSAELLLLVSGILDANVTI